MSNKKVYRAFKNGPNKWYVWNDNLNAMHSSWTNLLDATTTANRLNAVITWDDALTAGSSAIDNISLNSDKEN